MANEFKVKHGYIDLSVDVSKIIVSDTNQKFVSSGKGFNDAGTTVNDIWSADRVSTAITAALGANDSMLYKGALNCSTNPNYPAADAGHTYKVSVSGKIGGASGINVEIGDMIICTTDATAAGTQAAVGANWNIIQSNLDGAVIGPASVSTTRNIAIYSGTTGKLLQDSLASIDETGSINIPTGQTYKINNVALSKSDIGLSSVTNDAQLKIASNLSDLNSASTARTNLGLGGAAILNVGTTTGTVAAGDDSRIVNAVPNSRTVNGYALSSNVTLTKSDVGLGNVTNDAQVKKISSSTDNAIARWNTATGDLIQNSTVLLDDSGRINNYSQTLGTSTSAVADQFLKTTTTAVEWTVIVENGTTDSLTQKILVWHDGTTALYNEYGIIYKGNGYADVTFTVTVDATNLILTAVNASSARSYTIRTKRELL